MSRLFGNLEYNLAENFIYNQEEGTLKFQVLTFLLKHLCRKDDIINYFFENIENIRASEKTSNNKIAVDLTEKFTNQIILEANNSNFSFKDPLLTFIKESIYFVAAQVCDLFKKEIVAKDDWMNVSLLVKNLSITKQGTVNLTKTLHQILTREQLDPSHSCELACYYFITDEIVNNHCEMVINQQSSYFEGHAKHKAVKECLNYWRWFILNCGKENLKILLKNTHEMHRIAVNFIGNDEIKSYIINFFENLVIYNNEIAIHYLWTNVFSKIENFDFKKLLVNVIPCPLHVNIIMFLLCQIDIEKLLSFQKSWCLLILENMFQNFRWHFFFVKILNELRSLLDLDSFLNFLDILIIKHSFDFSSEINIIIECLNSFPFYSRNCLSFNNNHVLKKTFLSGKKNLLNALFKTYAKDIDFLDFLHTDSGSDLIFETIKIGNFEFIKNFILEKYITSDIINLKKFWFSGKGEILYEHFMEIGQFETLYAVIDWLSEEAPESLQDFKETMLNTYKELFVKNSIFRSNIDPDADHFASANKFLLWSLNSKLSISLFKRNINLCPNKDSMVSENMVSCYDELITWILKSKWKLIKLFFGWKDCLFYEKSQFLKYLIKDNNSITKIISKARKRYDFFSSFLNFLKKHLSLNYSDMQDLKRNIFESILNQNPDFSDFLRRWYANSGSADRLKSYIQSTGKEFPDYYTLCYLTSQDSVLNS